MESEILLPSAALELYCKQYKRSNFTRPAGAKRKKGTLYIEFDENARKEFITGFRKRKQERRKKAEEERKNKLKKKRQEERRLRREAILQSMGILCPPPDEDQEEEGLNEQEEGSAQEYEGADTWTRVVTATIRPFSGAGEAEASDADDEDTEEVWIKGGREYRHANRHHEAGEEEPGMGHNREAEGKGLASDKRSTNDSSVETKSESEEEKEEKLRLFRKDITILKPVVWRRRDVERLRRILLKRHKT